MKKNTLKRLQTCFDEINEQARMVALEEAYSKNLEKLIILKELVKEQLPSENLSNTTSKTR